MVQTARQVGLNRVPAWLKLKQSPFTCVAWQIHCAIRYGRRRSISLKWVSQEGRTIIRTL